MSDLETKQAIQSALAGFTVKPLAEAATALFESLGYKSQKRFVLKPNTAKTFTEHFAKDKPLNPDHALLADWQSVDFLFQLTDEEVRAAAQGNQQFLFEAHGRWNGAEICSFLFLAITLAKPHYTRTQLSTITRAVNRLFPMPVMLLFRHGDTLTLALIPRRLHKRDESKDVLEKVTLIKDIRFANPHRAHVEILADLSFDALHEKHGFSNFVALQAAWQDTLDIQALNKRFFIEVRNWFYWARLHARFPDGAKKDADKRDSEALIRLLTRMIFCWFLREKRLIPGELFAERTLETLVSDWRADDCEKDKQGRYYKAILQNLFFATLNTPIEERKFRSARSYQGKNKHYGDQRYFRHVALFQEKAPVEELYKTIPFLNGGLFEMLDEIPGRGDDSITEEKRVDGFSDVADKQPLVPDFLFFGDERRVPELSALLGESTAPKARGLIKIFRDYKFTIEENTPLEQDIALDPDLLGRAFENLLAAVNPETGATARKSTGSFYTPREIVNYMVEEAVFRHLLTALDASKFAPSPPTQRSGVGGEGRGEVGSSLSRSAYLGERLRELIAADKESHRFSDTEANAIVAAIGQMQILDPACGSGAFPMGLLQRLVHVLHKLDPGNVRWKAAKLATLPQEMRVKAEEVFRKESFDYTRKLELIKDCIHGVDIQPAAIQISKLRFFLSLVIEQNDPRHVRPLPNLETKFVCANSLLGLPRPEGWELFQHQIEPHERALLDVRTRFFFAQTQKEKDACRAEDLKLRQKLSDFIEGIGGDAAHLLASAVAGWNPYKPDRVAGYFDPESMFGVPDGFDIAIANPPYVRQEAIKEQKPVLKAQGYECFEGVADLFVYFYEKSVKLLRPGGVLTFISSNKYYRAGYGEKLRAFLARELTLHQLLDFGDAPVFDAVAYASILIGSKAAPPNDSVAVAHTWPPEAPLEDFAKALRERGVKIPQRDLKPDGWRLESPAVLRLLEKLRRAGKPLGEYVKENIYFGIKTGLNEAFVVDRATRDRLICEHKSSAEILKPFMRGKDIDRWRAEFADQFVVKIESSENKSHAWSGKSEKEAEKLFAKTFPAVHSHFENFRPELIKRDDQGKYFWEQRSCKYWQEFDKPKIVSTKISIRPTFALDSESRYLGNTAYFFPAATSGHYLLGFLNSSLFFTYAKQVFVEKQGGWFEVQPDGLEAFPIPAAPSEKQKPLERLVERILSAKQRDAGADVSALERELDELVYALYGLTPEEIKIVEEASA